MRVIGWPPRTCHERVAVRREESGPERNRDRESDSGNRGAGECLEVEDALAYGGTEGVLEEDLEGLRESIIGIP